MLPAGGLALDPFAGTGHQSSPSEPVVLSTLSSHLAKKQRSPAAMLCALTLQPHLLREKLRPRPNALTHAPLLLARGYRVDNPCPTKLVDVHGTPSAKYALIIPVCRACRRTKLPHGFNVAKCCNSWKQQQKLQADKAAFAGEPPTAEQARWAWGFETA